MSKTDTGIKRADNSDVALTKAQRDKRKMHVKQKRHRLAAERNNPTP